MFEVAFDMETSDPDDVCALLFLCFHREVNLKAVTVTPGTKDQIGLIKSFLKKVGKENIPVGSRKPDHAKDCVSGFFRKHYEVKPAEPDGLGWEILANFFRNEKYGILFTGASLGNPRALLENTTDVEIPRWVGQGGFAGDSIVPEKWRLDKFKGMETCPTFNFNGDVEGAKLMLCSPRIHCRQLVSKNVCHGVVYDKALHEEMKEVKFFKYKSAWDSISSWLGEDVGYEPEELHYPAFNEMLALMDKYLDGHPAGKLYHDPLAATAIISGEVITYEEVEVYRENGKWGSRKQEGTGTLISIHADKEHFQKVLAGGI